MLQSWKFASKFRLGGRFSQKFWLKSDKNKWFLDGSPFKVGKKNIFVQWLGHKCSLHDECHFFTVLIKLFCSKEKWKCGVNFWTDATVFLHSFFQIPWQILGQKLTPIVRWYLKQIVRRHLTSNCKIIPYTNCKAIPYTNCDTIHKV